MVTTMVSVVAQPRVGAEGNYVFPFEFDVNVVQNEVTIFAII
jgi:hypothetical protein